MTQFKTYGEDFPPRFAGHAIEVEFKTLPGEAAAFCREQKRKDNWLQAQLGVLGLAIQTLKVDGKTYIRPAGRKARRANSKEAVQIGQNIPQIMDPETEAELWAALLAYVVEHDWWLKRGEYREMFEEFFDEDDDDVDDDEEGETERENPTPSPGGGTLTQMTPRNSE